MKTKTIYWGVGVIVLVVILAYIKDSKTKNKPFRNTRPNGNIYLTSLGYNPNMVIPDVLNNSINNLFCKKFPTNSKCVTVYT